MRSIPGMDILLAQDWSLPWQEELGRETVKRHFNADLTQIRRKLLEGEIEDVSMDALRLLLEKNLELERRFRLRPVINATGVVIHTNLGRSLLAEEALVAVMRVGSSYNTLEYDLEAGARGQRNSHVEGALCALTGAEAALVVNNNAGAVLLCLSALAQGTEVVVSRGELVEIGGSFRVPDIMKFSGAELVEVGTTNRTHLRDYSEGITERASMLLKVHPSNFRMEGFTAAPEREELAALAHERGLIFMEDAGSGLLIEGQLLGLSGETDVRTCLEAGADVVTFSGDKMLGGPQLGIIVGKKRVIDRLKRHQVLRALRVDKMTLAAFEATLRLYAKGDYDKIPTLAMLRRSSEDMKVQARRLASKLRTVTSASITVLEVEDAVGGGSSPALPLPGFGVAVSSHPAGGAGTLQAFFRSLDLPLICGARENSLVLHVRTLSRADEAAICNAFELLEQEKPEKEAPGHV
ncbi:MAG: L-seryl-tRNA(Sec) selenium transferase [Fretibacterium sp.]|nr:L-seryl-tRNA(Sec) selenium transferase [Fretibacterium sp.]